MPLLIGGGVAALIVVVLLLILNANLDKQTAAVVVSAGKIWGKADAPVTVEIFSDFQ